MVVQPDALNPSCREWGGDQTGSDHRQRVRGGRGGVTQPGPLQGRQLEGKRITSTRVSGPDSKDPVLNYTLKLLVFVRKRDSWNKILISSSGPSDLRLTVSGLTVCLVPGLYSLWMYLPLPARWGRPAWPGPCCCHGYSTLRTFIL